MIPKCARGEVSACFLCFLFLLFCHKLIYCFLKFAVWPGVCLARSKERQKEWVSKLTNGDLPENEMVIWYDWMQSMSLPLANRETSTMWFAPSRFECSVFGACVWRKQGGMMKRTNVIIVSDILDHTSIFAKVLLKEVTKQLGSLAGLSKVWLFSDCGSHFRAYEHVGNVYDVFCCEHRLQTFLCFFCEKHGKGHVDSTFARFKMWYQAALQKPGTQLCTVSELVNAAKLGALAAEKTDPQGDKNIIVALDMPAKSETSFRLTATGLQIEKTYCVSLAHEVLPHCTGPKVQNYVFCDRTNMPCGRLAGVHLQPVPPDGEWRRGYYGSMSWKKDLCDW